ncbi:MAG: hypothetical protein K8F60_15455 [Melioribacteraceae bacterium]|jgi:hypothetical protein|nr:toxin-antitoxin system, antitoxin component [Ignavibacteriota bacterium]MBZ0183856.1 hypothetical protein [Melioribacteraceae bacterium]|tara:strand:+ start:595 stop:825 length:231 start_codon:yes stop_codon:yes gene_type:complete
MPQISLYIDKETLNKIEIAAKSENSSISKWVSTKIKKSIENKWPDNYFSLFGKLRDDSFIRDNKLDFNDDLKRENF